jgi:hypothetical protein
MMRQKGGKEGVEQGRTGVEEEWSKKDNERGVEQGHNRS